MSTPNPFVAAQDNPERFPRLIDEALSRFDSSAENERKKLDKVIEQNKEQKGYYSPPFFERAIVK